jgi:hypothetical protein
MAGPITYDSKFDVEPGEYLARFIELKDKDPFENSKFGNGNEPRYGWQFEIVGPPGTPMMGKIIEQNTGTNPTKRSGLIRLLDMMIPGGIQPKQTVNPPDFIGRLYRINWKVNPDSDKGNCHIAFLAEVGAGASTTPPPRTVTNPHAPPVQAAPPQSNSAAPLIPPGTLPVPPAPPPRRGAQQAPRPAAPPAQQQQQRYFIVHEKLNGGEKPALLTGQEVQAFLDTHHMPPESLEVCAEGAQEWKTAADFGFKDSVPY